MMTLLVHTQEMMSHRIDVMCPNCGERLIHFPKVPNNDVRQCFHCNVPIPASLKLYKDRTARFYWHFYKQPI